MRSSFKNRLASLEEDTTDDNEIFVVFTSKDHLTGEVDHVRLPTGEELHGEEARRWMKEHEPMVTLFGG